MKANHQNQMKLSQLRILVTVAKQGNFSEAALHLEMSQSVVSHAIAALEEHLGVVLFLRGRHGARLTSVGERILETKQANGEVVRRKVTLNCHRKSLTSSSHHRFTVARIWSRNQVCPESPSIRGCQTIV